MSAAAQVWMEMPPMKIARLGPGVAAMGASLIAVGGATESGKVLNSAESLNFAPTDLGGSGGRFWDSIPDMKIGRGAPGVAVIDNKMWVMGGCDDKGRVL